MFGGEPVGLGKMGGGGGGGGGGWEGQRRSHTMDYLSKSGEKPSQVKNKINP